MTLQLTSPAFEHGGEIPSVYTCDGDDMAPALAWTGVPAEAQSLALIVDDPDAPDPEAPKMTWVHWVLYNIPVFDPLTVPHDDHGHLLTNAVPGIAASWSPRSGTRSARGTSRHSRSR